MFLLVCLLTLIRPVGDSLRWVTPFEQSHGTETATYHQAISWYQKLAKAYPQIQVKKSGMTDSGLPLHVVVISKDRRFDPAQIRLEGKSVLFIDNGIHPGEPCGIDASMMLARDLVQKPAMKRLLNHVVVVIIPIYNIGGSLNRSWPSRANQNGPKSYGFRGNARNLDLDRDFIKSDSRNMKSFAPIFHRWNPDVMIDNHASDGADYQYVMTLIETQQDVFNPVMRRYYEAMMRPALYEGMKKEGYPMTPYVESFHKTPDSGIDSFMDYPRFSSGYAALFNTISFITETHMLKPYRQRVGASCQFMRVMLQVMNRDYHELLRVRSDADRYVAAQKEFRYNWKMDTTSWKPMEFNGYAAEYHTSKVTGLPQLYYDEHEPYTKQIRYYDRYIALDSVRAPQAFILPQAWFRVAERLRGNGVILQPLKHDTAIAVTAYHIADYKTFSRPYEGHYPHSDVTVNPFRDTLSFRKGDYLIRMNQKTNRYIMEVLDPRFSDSFFRWNFFDSVLMQKEYFESYVFDTVAVGILHNHPALDREFRAKQESDTSFANDVRGQLNWIYKRSKYFEPVYMRYPVYRVE
ncbi:MAG TPA: M14 family zinc carboxypeptidase [Balneolales bacterium]|nr:M14 family zinc carboxypeptidase [Balneolales bacterium]